MWRRDPLAALRDEMNELRARLWGDEEQGWLAGTTVPSLDMTESDVALEIRMDVPGIKAKDIDIQLNGNIITISGQREEEKEEKGKTYHRIERRSGSFSRTLTLPCSVSQDEVVADYRDGVLTVTLPKSEESKAHKVKVKG
jgi:HSP20 family protein